MSHGLMVAVNRQRLGEMTQIEATREVHDSQIAFVCVHLVDARPDQGRKTLQKEVMEHVNRAADHAVQYLAAQRPFLRTPGEFSTAGQRAVEKNHGDWKFNVQKWRETNPLELPPLPLCSEPLMEQDVVGLFHQLCVCGVFPGIRILSTSQHQTYDCLVEFSLPSADPRLRYGMHPGNPLGLSAHIIGPDDGAAEFETGLLTVEFKNSLDGFVDEMARPGKKSFDHIDLLVCWSQINDSFRGYALEKITAANLDERAYPGVTHILRRELDSAPIGVVMLKRIIELAQAGAMDLQSGCSGEAGLATSPNGGTPEKRRKEPARKRRRSAETSA